MVKAWAVPLPCQRFLQSFCPLRLFSYEIVFFADIFGEKKQLHFSCVEELNEFPVACAYRATRDSAEEMRFLQRVMPIDGITLWYGYWICPVSQY